jgi:hypothetical protein
LKDSKQLIYIENCTMKRLLLPVIIASVLCFQPPADAKVKMGLFGFGIVIAAAVAGGVALAINYPKQAQKRYDQASSLGNKLKKKVFSDKTAPEKSQEIPPATEPPS